MAASTTTRENLVCLECWRGFTQDIFHFDCTGEHTATKEEADKLHAWVSGRYKFAVKTGQKLVSNGKNKTNRR